MKEKLISITTAKILHNLKIKFDENATVHVMWSKDCDYKTKIPFEPNVFLNGNYYEDFEYDLEDFKKIFEKGNKYLNVQFPTQSLLQKYLREVHDIYVESYHDYDPKDGTYQYYTNWGFNDPNTIEKKQSGWYDEYNNWKTYEDALEFGLKQGLGMVKSAQKDENDI